MLSPRFVEIGDALPGHFQSLLELHLADQEYRKTKAFRHLITWKGDAMIVYFAQMKLTFIRTFIENVIIITDFLERW